MKALTICEPYATLIARGLKRVENRTWHAPQHVIGQRIAIHAGKSRQWLTSSDNYGIPTAELTFGAVVATARLVESVDLMEAFKESAAMFDRFQAIGWNLQEFQDHEHTEGPVCWVLSDVQPLATPIPYSGAQGFWNLPDGVLEPKAPAP